MIYYILFSYSPIAAFLDQPFACLCYCYTTLPAKTHYFYSQNPVTRRRQLARFRLSKTPAFRFRLFNEV